MKLAKQCLALTFVMMSGFGLTSYAAAHQDGTLKSSGTGVFGPSIPVDDPTFCFGENDLGQCVLYFGSANSCNNVNPCNNNSIDVRPLKQAINRTLFGGDDLTFCYGLDNTTDECKLFLGSEESCANVAPCQLEFKQLKKARKTAQ